jgi:hypothetical protein
MSLWHVVGVALIVVGLVEVVVFRSLAPRKPNIARLMPFLMGNSALNVTLGVAVLAWAFTH